MVMVTKKKQTHKQLIVKCGSPRKEIIKYLESKGWYIAVSGDMGVVHEPDSPMKYNQWFVFKFTGLKEQKGGEIK